MGACAQVRRDDAQQGLVGVSEIQGVETKSFPINGHSNVECFRIVNGATQHGGEL